MKLHFSKPLLFLIILLFSCTSKSPRDITIRLIGDSTMAVKKSNRHPETGWGEALQDLFNNHARVKNYAVNGRSSKSFIDEGHWQAVVDSLKPGDFVFIQFGHNDEKFQDSNRYTNPTTIYRLNLMRLIQDTREKRANPILFTPIVRRNYNEFGVLMDTHGLYPSVVREVARDYGVPLIDLQLLTEQLVLSLGESNSKKLFLWLESGENENYPEGVQDNTHLNRRGAERVAGLVAQEIKNQDLALKSYLKTDAE
jgi:lysophospholipase L1-like esterase